MINISIIVPTYNSDKHIFRCLESLLQKSSEDMEILVVDHNSIDNTINIVSAYKENHPNVHLLNSPFKGPSAQRAFGISKARGEYISFVDSDDCVDVNLFNKAVEYLRAYKSECLFFDWITIDDYIEPLSFPPEDESCKVDVIKNDDFLKYDCFGFQCWNKVVSRGLATKALKFYNEKVTFISYEDSIFSLFLLKNSPTLLHYKRSGYIYFNNPKSVTHKNIKHIDALDNYRKLLMLIEPYGADYYYHVAKPILHKIIHFLIADADNFHIYKEIFKRSRIKPLMKCIKKRYIKASGNFSYSDRVIIFLLKMNCLISSYYLCRHFNSRRKLKNA